MRIRAIVLDDDPGMCDLISQVLHQRGYAVTACNEPRTCPFYLDRDVCACPVGHACADILISDLRMPAMTGLECIDNQKKHGCKVPHIAIMSGAWSEEDRMQALKKHYKLLEKPFALKELEAWLDRCERKIALHRELARINALLNEDKSQASQQERV